MEDYKSKITGHLEIFVHEKEENEDNKIVKWRDILIHGDPEGLKSLAKILLEIADLNQDNILELPIGEREHIHLQPKYDLSASSEEVIIGRLDAKGTGKFYERFIARNK
ncbi:MAG TPA: hypothetical protein VK559_02985 [Ferruginibacter sp.]|nr:hypothetical protein [Ferruginibacter sp.]